jgi:hypothetical protein
LLEFSLSKGAFANKAIVLARPGLLELPRLSSSRSRLLPWFSALATETRELGSLRRLQPPRRSVPATDSQEHGCGHVRECSRYQPVSRHVVHGRREITVLPLCRDCVLGMNKPRFHRDSALTSVGLSPPRCTAHPSKAMCQSALSFASLARPSVRE